MIRTGTGLWATALRQSALAASSGNPTPTPTPQVPLAFTPPVRDWRAVATAVTDLAGAPQAALLAQQASAATKTRGASVTIPTSGEAGAIFTVDAHAQDILATFTGHNGFISSAIVDYSTDGGVTWTDSGYTIQTIIGGNNAGSSGRAQVARIPAGPAKRIRLRLTTINQFAIKPVLFKLPASGKPPIFGGFGNSLFYYPFEADAVITAIMAANPGLDPLVLNWAQPSANGSTIANSVTSFAAAYPNLARYAISQGINGTAVTAQRPYLSSQKTGLDANYNTLCNALDALGCEHLMLPDTFRDYDTDPLVPPSNQALGVLGYNQGATVPYFASRIPAMYDTNYQTARFDSYLFWLWIHLRGEMGDHIHPGETGLVTTREFYAQRVFPAFFNNTSPKAEIVYFAERVEASALQSDYDNLTYALMAIPDAAPGKAAIQARLTATVPAVKYKSAQTAIAKADADTIVAETSHLQVNKDTAQASIAAAQTAITTAATSGSAGTGALQTQLDAIQARLNLVSVITVTKRTKTNLGQATMPTGYGAALTANGTVATINDTDGTVTGWTLTAAGIGSSSTANGISGGTSPTPAPNDHNSQAMYSYVSGTGPITLTLANLDPTRQYNFYLAAGRNGSTDALMGATAVGNNTVPGDPASVQPTGSYKAIVMKGVRPTTGGTITITIARVAPNTGFIYANSLVVEEATV